MGEKRHVPNVPKPICFFAYPRILESRADDGTLTLHIRKGLILSLKKNSILAKDLAIVSSRGTDFDTAVLNGLEVEKNLYVDTHHHSSVVVNIMKDRVEVRGMINHELRISPVGASRRSDGFGALHEVVKVNGRADDGLLDALYAMSGKERSSHVKAPSPRG
ncbi:uncharacterized protein LOC144103400 [Amblyomma americanum]